MKIKVNIPDMQSSHCQLRVKNAVSRIPGVIVSTIHPGEIEMDLSEVASQKEVSAAITDAGYTVAGISSEGQNNSLQFRTNINCSGCVAQVSPFLDNAEGIDKWEVDVKSPERLLTVDANGISASEIMQKVNEAGFNIEPVNH
jgi:copper chaperone CopZ